MSGLRSPFSPRFIAPALLIAVAVTITALAGCRQAESAPEVIRPAVLAQPAAAAGNAPSYFSGEVRARHESQLGFRVAGKIQQRHVDVGAQVQAGQVLAVLDPADLRLDLGAAEAMMTAAQADLDLAQSEHDRYATLLERSLISVSQFEIQQTALSAAQARLDQARAELAVRRNQLDYTQLRADRAGVITAIHVETGQVVAAGQTVALLAQEGELEVEIALPEAQVQTYQPGTAASITLWSDGGTRHVGRIREIAPDADAASRTYRARVTFVEADGSVQLGRTARVRFESEDPSERLRIPLAALHALNLQPAVWIVDPNAHTVALKPVEVARYGEDAAEIESGLKAEDWLVVAGVHTLHQGQRIRPIDRDNRAIRF